MRYLLLTSITSISISSFFIAINQIRSSSNSSPDSSKDYLLGIWLKLFWLGILFLIVSFFIKKLRPYALIFLFSFFLFYFIHYIEPYAVFINKNPEIMATGSIIFILVSIITLFRFSRDVY